MTRITDIVDNRAAEVFVAEHGLSLLIEHGDERILFDTGAGAALWPNAAKLGIDLDGVTPTMSSIFSVSALLFTSGFSAIAFGSSLIAMH